MRYRQMDPEEAHAHRPSVVFVDAENHITETTRYEHHGETR